SFSSGNYQEVKLLEDVILPSYDELNTMLETRQQTLLLPESAAGRIVHVEVTGPLGHRVNAFYGLSGDARSAFIEMAAASGLE
ncbi:glycerate kinase, partial [Salmonella enterica subsp. enterica serovar Montevideo]|nr:glycerate kinase [Salmonella enterica subsp. enterica serovar Montevideo]